MINLAIPIFGPGANYEDKKWRSVEYKHRYRLDSHRAYPSYIGSHLA